jgi:hypothetical protein
MTHRPQREARTQHPNERRNMMALDRNSASPTGDRWGGTADGSWMLWTAFGTTGIWVAVVLISLFAPDMVSGSEQQHLAIAAFTTWLWGAIGTGFFVWTMGRLRGSALWRSAWIGVSNATLLIWTVATIVAISSPEFVTGSDPTRIPVGAMSAPIGAVLLTALTGIVANVFRQGSRLKTERDPS